MTKRTSDDLGILNSSGFPFQLRVAELIKETPGQPGWRILAEEHHWQDVQTGDSGFIDVIAGYGIVRFVIECKRGAHATWLFLAREPDPTPVTRFRMLCTEAVHGAPDVRLWADLLTTPDSPESAFCVVRGQGDKEPMLERTAATLLQSVEALADEELSFRKPPGVGRRGLYIPVIVTAATLRLCRFDPSDVDLESGKLPSTAATFESVPFVRFRKALSRGRRESEAENLDASRAENQRSILIVQAKSLAHLLDYWTVSPAFGEEWPQTAARRRMQSAIEP